jgi:hypothetical protein
VIKFVCTGHRKPFVKKYEILKVQGNAELQFLWKYRHIYCIVVRHNQRDGKGTLDYWSGPTTDDFSDGGLSSTNVIYQLKRAAGASRLSKLPPQYKSCRPPSSQCKLGEMPFWASTLSFSICEHTFRLSATDGASPNNSFCFSASRLLGGGELNFFL